jgi:hypothetical protein
MDEPEEFRTARNARACMLDMAKQTQALYRLEGQWFSRAGGKKANPEIKRELNRPPSLKPVVREPTCPRFHLCPFFGTDKNCRGGRECERKTTWTDTELQLNRRHTREECKALWLKRGL